QPSWRHQNVPQLDDRLVEGIDFAGPPPPSESPTLIPQERSVPLGIELPERLRDVAWNLKVFRRSFRPGFDPFEKAVAGSERLCVLAWPDEDSIVLDRDCAVPDA